VSRILYSKVISLISSLMNSKAPAAFQKNNTDIDVPTETGGGSLRRRFGWSGPTRTCSRRSWTAPLKQYNKV
jgi:hypothetical protein